MGIPYYWINIKYKEKKTYSVNEKKLVINNLTTIHINGSKQEKNR